MVCLVIQTTIKFAMTAGIINNWKVIVQPSDATNAPPKNGLNNAPMLPHKFIQPDTVPASFYHVIRHSYPLIHPYHLNQVITRKSLRINSQYVLQRKLKLRTR